MEDVESALRLRGKRDGFEKVILCKELRVALGDDPTFFVPAFEMAQADAQYRGLKRVEAAVDADLFVEIGVAGAVDAQALDA